jgi:hypothetical protein
LSTVPAGRSGMLGLRSRYHRDVGRSQNGNAMAQSGQVCVAIARTGSVLRQRVGAVPGRTRRHHGITGRTIMSHLTRPGLKALPPYVPGRDLADLARQWGIAEFALLATNEVP